MVEIFKPGWKYVNPGGNILTEVGIEIKNKYVICGTPYYDHTKMKFSVDIIQLESNRYSIHALVKEYDIHIDSQQATNCVYMVLNVLMGEGVG